MGARLIVGTLPSVNAEATPDTPAEIEPDERDARIDELEAEVAKLRLDLWASRDAAIGALAEVGTSRARFAEVESLVHQLRTELALAGGTSGRRTPGYYVDRVARGVYRRIRR